MRQQLQRVRQQLMQYQEQHPAMEAALEQLLKRFDDALQPPLSRQVSFIHEAQRLIKICVTKAYQDKELIKKILNASDPLWSQMPSLPVDTELKKHLAEQLFHSSGAQKDEKIIIATTQDGKEVTEELIRLCLLEGVDFELGIKDPERMMLMINHLNDEAFQALSNLNLMKYEGVHREIIVSSSSNPQIKKQINQDRMDSYKRMNQAIHDRAMSGDLHYTLTRIPTLHDAAQDDMAYEDYLRLFFELCDQPWEEIETAQQKLIQKFDQAEKVFISNDDGTEVLLDITGQTFANSVIAKNIPGAEIFSSPLREGVDGTLVSRGKFRYGSGGMIENITLKFEKGRIIEYSAEVGQDDLERIVTADDDQGEGTRHIGELGIGTNPHLRQHVVNSLLVEKIGGSFHLALGSCYTYDHYLGTPVRLKNGNKSMAGVHWDLTTMLRDKNGQMKLDGELVQENGDWIGDDFVVLNQGWGALAQEDQPSWWKERYPNGY